MKTTKLVALFISALLLLLFNISIHAQEYVCQWAKSIGYSTKAIDSEGNLYIIKSLQTASTFTLGDTDFTFENPTLLLVKCNSDLEIIWSQDFQLDESASIINLRISSTNSILLAGNISFKEEDLPDEFSGTPFTKCYAAELDTNGDISKIWTSNGNLLEGSDIIIDDDSYYITANFEQPIEFMDSTYPCNDYLGNVLTGILLKFSSECDFLWGESSYLQDFSQFDYLEFDNYGNIYVGGTSFEYQYNTPIIRKYSSTRELLWTKRNTAPSGMEAHPSGYCRGICVDKESSDVYLNINSYGPLRFDGQYFQGPGYHLIAKFNEDGEHQWYFNFGGRMGFPNSNFIINNDSIHFVTMLSDSLLIDDDYIYASSFANILMGSIDLDGNILNYKQYTSSQNTYQTPWQILKNDDNVYISFENIISGTEAGETWLDTITINHANLYFAKFMWDDDYTKLEHHRNNNISIFPNPTSNHFEIKTLNDDEIKSISLLSLQGTTISVFDNKLANSRFDISNISSGIYLLKIELCDEIIIKKIIISETH